MIEHLGQQMTVLLEEPRTVGDPAAAEAQIESISSEVAEQVAAANARATRAEQAQRQGEAQKEKADAAARKATRAGEQSAQELSGVREELDGAQARKEQFAMDLVEVRAETAGLQPELDSVRVQPELTEQDRDAAIARAGSRKTHGTKPNSGQREPRSGRSWKQRVPTAKKPRSPKPVRSSKASGVGMTLPVKLLVRCAAVWRP